MTPFASPTGEPRFTDRTVLIMGGAVGIGLAFARRAASEGAHVILSDLSLPASQGAVVDLPGPGQHSALALDVTDTNAVNDAVDAAADIRGRLDVLVNVAGGDTHNPTFDQTSDESWARMLDLNLMSVVRTCRAAVPHLRRSTRSPAIVNVSSINALTALGITGHTLPVDGGLLTGPRPQSRP